MKHETNQDNDVNSKKIGRLVRALVYNIFLLTGLRIYTGEYKAQGPTLCPTEGRALRGPRDLDSPV